MLVQEERRIGRDVSCGRAGESWCLTDDGGDCVERTQAAMLGSLQRVLRLLSVHPASCWARAGAGSSSRALG